MSKPTLGIIGGGQLGSMLAIAANKLEIKTIIFCDDIDAPAQNFSNEFIHGDYNDQNKINEFVNKVDVITFEFENIPFETLNEINKSKPVLPRPSVNRIIQHRLAEKDFINKLNIRTTRYVSIEKKSEIESVQDMLPGLLKTTTLGYEEQILKYSKIPAEIENKVLEQSKLWAMQIAEELKYVGTLCVEFFIDRNDNLYVNEIAPRVHNSGHLTINAYNVSQFENHIRAVCKLEQIALKKISNAKMKNIIGNEISFYRNKKYEQNEFFFDYLKKEIKSKRKMGHLTTLIK